MAGKPWLHYFNGRGRMESIQWLLAAARVEVRCGFIQIIFVLGSLSTYLGKSGTLMYGQHLVPFICNSFLNYHPFSRIGMYVEGLKDLSDMIMFLPLSLPEEEMNLAHILEKATTRFFPVCEKALRDHRQDFLVCNWLSWADTQQPEVILMTEECKPSVLFGFPLLQKFKARSSHIPTINKFLQPGSQRKSPLDEESIETVKNIFKLERGMFLKNMSSTVAEY
uniref:glutathione transferase n=1 Tax=Piliocolobus tephrosceles TaxID=591936 RepID=A0A8C9GRE1_9PRIM